MYHVYNNILRDVDSGDGSATANRYPTTIQLIISGIRKLSTIAKMPEGGAVFRGLSGLALPPEFFELDKQGCAGGVEASFMSTTLSEEVARKYSGVNEGREATIFCLQLAKILKSQEHSACVNIKLHADFWEILSGQDVTRRRHQLAVAVCQGARDALPAAHTSPDRGCTFSKKYSLSCIGACTRALTFQNFCQASHSVATTACRW